MNEGIKRKHILHFLVADESTGFLARSRVPPQRRNSREIGKACQQKWKTQHQNHDDYDFFIKYEYETSSTTPLIILVFKRLWSINPPPCDTWHGNRRRWINFSLQMFELRIYMWLIISFLSGYPLEFNFSRYIFSCDYSKHGHNVGVFTLCAGR